MASESPGVYGRPGFNILAGARAVSLPNAREATGDKARQTEVIDAEGWAELLGHGLRKPSFLPARPIGELRDLRRERESLGREQPARAQRLQQLIASANGKLGQGAREALGVRGKQIVRA